MNPFYKIKNLRIFSKLEVITYGLYCLHFIGILTTATITANLDWKYSSLAGLIF